MNPEKIKEIGKICIPGMRLSLANKEFVSGSGTYELRGYIYSTLAGVLKMKEDEKTKVNTLTGLLFEYPNYYIYSIIMLIKLVLLLY